MTEPASPPSSIDALRRIWPKATWSDCNVLSIGRPVEIEWWPPTDLRPLPSSAKPEPVRGYRYAMRLHWEDNEGTWYLDMTDPRDGSAAWLPVLGPMTGPRQPSPRQVQQMIADELERTAR